MLIKILRFGFLSLFLSQIGHSSTGTQEILNQMMEVYKSKYDGPACTNFLENLEKLEKSDLDSQVLNDIRYFFEKTCSDPDYFIGNEKSEYIGNSQDAFCSISTKQTGCQWNRESARGYFILKQPSYDREISAKVTPESWPNYLVCAHGIHHRDYFIFADKDMIGANCVISNVIWDLYPKKPETNYRSDIKGLYNWMEINTKSPKILIPDELVKQCQMIFKDSYYCTPTLIALPTIFKDQVDVCYLEGGNRTINTPFVQVDFLSSTWKCERFNLGNIDLSSPLKKGEEKCIPKIDSSFKIPSCNLPYLPRIQEVNLIKKLPCGTKDGFQTIHRFNSGAQCEHPWELPFVPIRDISKLEDNKEGLKKLADFYSHSPKFFVAFPRARVDEFFIKVPSDLENPVKRVHWTCGDGEAFGFYFARQEKKTYLGPFVNSCKDKVIRTISAHIKTKIPIDLIKLELFGRINEI